MRPLTAYLAGVFSVVLAAALLAAWRWVFAPGLALAFVVMTEAPITHATLRVEGETHRASITRRSPERVFGWVDLRPRHYPPAFELAWTGPDGRERVLADAVPIYAGLSHCIFYVRLDAAGDVIADLSAAGPDNGLRVHCYLSDPRPDRNSPT